MLPSKQVGKLTFADIKNTLIALGDNPTDEEVREMIAGVGCGEDGVDFPKVLLIFMC